MAFELPKSLETGIGELDDDHRELVSHVNVIADAEKAVRRAEIVNGLTAFRTHLTKHFQREEANLKSVGYPKLGAHARHHAEIVTALDRLIRDVEANAPLEGVAHICFHELVSVVLLRDMQFLNWLADQRTRIGPSNAG